MNNRIKEAYLNGARNSLQKVASPTAAELMNKNFVFTNPTLAEGSPKDLAKMIFDPRRSQEFRDSAMKHLLLRPNGTQK